MWEPGNAGEVLAKLLDGVPGVVDATLTVCSQSFGGEPEYSITVTLDSGRQLEVEVHG
jgi:hypothetical protein